MLELSAAEVGGWDSGLTAGQSFVALMHICAVIMSSAVSLGFCSSGGIISEVRE